MPKTIPTIRPLMRLHGLLPCPISQKGSGNNNNNNSVTKTFGKWSLSKPYFVSLTKMKLCFLLSFGLVQIFIRTQKTFLTNLESEMVFPSGQREKVFSLSKSIDLHFSESCTTRFCIRKLRISLVHINPPKSFYTYDFKEKCLYKSTFRNVRF